MSIVLGLLTVVMVLDCVLLVFLILLQLPKKEAGAGMAFGGAATDALFGAGSGNVLTKITKYVAGIFFGLALIMAIITANLNRPQGSALLNALSERPAGGGAPIPTTPASTPASPGGGLISSALLTNAPQNAATPETAASKTNAPTAPARTNSAGSAPSLISVPRPATPTNR